MEGQKSDDSWGTYSSHSSTFFTKIMSLEDFPWLALDSLWAVGNSLLVADDSLWAVENFLWIADDSLMVADDSLDS